MYWRRSNSGVCYPDVCPYEEDAGGEFEPEQTNSATQQTTSNVVYTWKCGIGNGYVFKSYYNWYYNSYESAVLYKENNAWLFQSPLTHNTIERIGLTPPGYTYSHQLGSATSNIYPDKRSAKMEVQFVVYEEIIAIGQTKSWQISSGTKCFAP